MHDKIGLSMSMVDILYLIVLITLGLMSLLGTMLIGSFYTNPKLIPAEPPVWWAYDKKWWKKWARGAPTTFIITFLGVVTGALAEYGDPSSTATTKAILTTFFLATLILLVNIFTVLTGRPKWIIPKHLR